MRRWTLIAIGFALPLLARAGENPFVNAGKQAADVRQRASIPERQLEDIVGNVIKAAISIAGVFFFGYIVWAGFLWMTAHGEEEKITQAKKMISGGVIGLAIVLAAYAITVFIVTRLTESAGIK